MSIRFTLLLFSFLLLFKLFADEVSEGPKSGSAAYKKQDLVYQLIKQGRHLEEVENDLPAADSKLWKAVELAGMSYNYELMLEAANAYLESMDMGAYNSRRLSLIPQMERTLLQVSNPSAAARTYCNIALVYHSAYDFDKSLDYSYKAFSVADLAASPDWKAKSYVSIGKAMEGKNQLLEAFRNYLQALNLAMKIQDQNLEYDIHGVLSRFYHLSKDYDNAIKQKLKQLEILERKQDIDSVAFMWLQYDLEGINYSAFKTLNEMNMEDLLAYSTRHHQKRLKESTLALYRAFLIHSERIDKLQNFYLKSYPAEFEKIKTTDPSMYNRITALFLEKDGKPDEALLRWKTAETLLDKENNKIFLANFYIRFGQFLKRQGENAVAIGKFEKAWQLSHEAAYLDYALIASDELEQSYIILNDYKNAHKCARFHRELTDSLSNISKKDELLRLDIDNTARQLEEKKLLEEQETNRRHNLQYTAIIIIIGVIFLVLIMLGSVPVPRWSIQFLGFISFILLFEFIILIADQKIHHLTHGEPWKILAIKIVLIGIMLPLHHWIEKKVIHYLIHKKVITFKRSRIRTFVKDLFVREDPPTA
ncbi:MAG: hypothetical protein AB9842_07745 [Bacteroidales bacterium]